MRTAVLVDVNACAVFAQQAVAEEGELTLALLRHRALLLLDGEVIGEWESVGGIPRLVLQVLGSPREPSVEGILEDATPPRVTAEQGVLGEVFAELQGQHEKWGVQDHPVHARTSRRLSYMERARFWKRENDMRARDASLGWDGILLEEVYEALEQSDGTLQRPELIQVAAVAVQAVLALDRKA